MASGAPGSPRPVEKLDVAGTPRGPEVPLTLERGASSGMRAAGEGGSPGAPLPEPGAGPGRRAQEAPSGAPPGSLRIPFPDSALGVA